MVYVGVDLHRKRSHVVAMDAAGEVVLSRRIGNAPGEFLRIFGELEPNPIEVVFEAPGVPEVDRGRHQQVPPDEGLRSVLASLPSSAEVSCDLVVRLPGAVPCP